MIGNQQQGACVGKWELFDSTDSHDHFRAADLCAECPVKGWCRDWTDQVNRRYRQAGQRALTGTWAGRLYGADPADDARLAVEEAMFTEEESRAAHAAFRRGLRDDRTRIGERVWQRRAKRKRREARAGVAA